VLQFKAKQQKIINDTENFSLDRTELDQYESFPGIARKTLAKQTNINNRKVNLF